MSSQRYGKRDYEDERVPRIPLPPLHRALDKDRRHDERRTPQRRHRPAHGRVRTRGGRRRLGRLLADRFQEGSHGRVPDNEGAGELRHSEEGEAVAKRDEAKRRRVVRGDGRNPLPQARRTGRGARFPVQQMDPERQAGRAATLRLVAAAV